MTTTSYITQESPYRRYMEEYNRQMALQKDEYRASDIFWSGSDVHVYIHQVGGRTAEIPVAAAVTILQHEEGIPIYGFGSRDYDIVLPGNFLVSGTLTIAFVRTGYLQALIERAIEGTREQLFMAEEYAATGKGDTMSLRYTRAADAKAGYRYLEETMNTVAIALWDRGTSDKGHFGSPGSRRGTELTHTQSTESGGTRKPINMLCEFGQPNAPKNSTTDVLIPKTIITLADIRFQSCATSMTPTGEPVMETYAFIAKAANRT